MNFEFGAFTTSPEQGKINQLNYYNHDNNNPNMDDDLFSRGEVRGDDLVDEMKIQTMYKMVCDCDVSLAKKNITKKVLYLTNKQASLFDDQAMSRCIQALDLGEPKFLICLLPSLGSQNRKVHKEHTSLPFEQHSLFFPSEITEMDERTTEMEILLFMKTCILPIAMHTRALILVSGANDCSLSTALSHAVVAEQARLGKDCPFSVVATVNEWEVHHATMNQRKSISSQIAKNCPAWRKRIPFLNKVLENKPLQHCDLTGAATRYIIFESINEDTLQMDSSLQKSFESTFLQIMTQQLPSIAIQSNTIDLGLAHLSDIALRGIPILLIDTFERAITCCQDPEDTSKESLKTDLARESNAFPMIAHDELKKLELADDGTLTLRSRMFLLQLAKEMIERKAKIEITYGVYDNYDSAMLAFFHSVLLLGSDHVGKIIKHPDGLTFIPTILGTMTLGEKIIEMERFEKANKDAKRLIPMELATDVITFLQTRVEGLKKEAALARITKWIEQHRSQINNTNGNGNGNGNGKENAVIDEKSQQFNENYQAALKYQQELQQECENIRMKNGCVVSSDIKSTNWLALYDIFTHPNFYSGSIHDVESLKTLISSVGNIDRLPESNSLEALKTIQIAWDSFELYHQVANRYKIITKVTYLLLLCLGISVTVLSIINAQGIYPTRFILIIISFATTALVAFITFTNPALRWQQLRMAALTIESNIFTFRTRAGPYRVDGGKTASEDGVVSLLKASLTEIRNSILEGADIKNTLFYSRVNRSNLHGQHLSKDNSLLIPIDRALQNAPKIIPINTDYEDYVNSHKKVLKSVTRHSMSNNPYEQLEEGYNNNNNNAGGGNSGSNGILGGYFSKKVDKYKPTALPPSSSLVKKSIKNTQNTFNNSSNINNNLNNLSNPLGNSKNVNPIDLDFNANETNNNNEEKGKEQQDDDKKNPNFEGEAVYDDPAAHEAHPSVLELLPVDRRESKYFRLDELATLLRQNHGKEKEMKKDLPDTHYEPLSADLYIKFRIQTMLQFYQKRIPRCYRIRMISQLIMVSGAILIGALAFFNLAIWTTVVTILTSATSAFIEFHGTNNKIDRYSFTVHALSELIVWWETLPQVDRTLVANIDRLVCTAEDLIQREQQAWKSTSQIAKMLQRAIDNAKNDGGNGNGSGGNNGDGRGAGNGGLGNGNNGGNGNSGFKKQQ